MFVRYVGRRFYVPSQARALSAAASERCRSSRLSPCLHRIDCGENCLARQEDDDESKWKSFLVLLS